MTPKFVIVSNPAVRWPVTIKIPADGGIVESRFEAQIRVYSEQEYESLLPKPQEGERTPDEVLAENAAFLPKFVLDWYGVTDEHGKGVPIHRLQEIIKGPYGIPLSVGLWRAVSEVRLGIDPQGGATEKNSAPSPAPGLAQEATGN
ncbi:MAG: hypothetical protein LBE22_07595 [Azoarcus sp.]|jgi:hypothetical protein|nr:hypothetical protein [Azoarcus sp.]